MLSELFLRTAVYRQLITAEEQRDGEKEKSLEKKRSSWKRRTVGGALSDGREPPGAPSPALCIPRREALRADSPDLYTSWSSWYGSLYKNYPDLHIAGDHILHKVDSGCVLDADCEDGPVLVSADIARSSPPNVTPGGLLNRGAPSSLESHTLPSAPCSNSVLNGFLEKKMQELYKQCLEEAQPPLWPAILMHHVHQISLQLSQELHVGHARATEAVLQSLCSATSGGSSEFITPVLHISSQDRAKPGALSSKGGPGHGKK